MIYLHEILYWRDLEQGSTPPSVSDGVRRYVGFITSAAPDSASPGDYLEFRRTYLRASLLLEKFGGVVFVRDEDTFATQEVSLWTGRMQIRCMGHFVARETGEFVYCSKITRVQVMVGEEVYSISPDEREHFDALEHEGGVYRFQGGVILSSKDLTIRTSHLHMNRDEGLFYSLPGVPTRIEHQGKQIFDCASGEGWSFGAQSKIVSVKAFGMTKYRFFDAVQDRAHELVTYKRGTFTYRYRRVDIRYSLESGLKSIDDEWVRYTKPAWSGWFQ